MIEFLDSRVEPNEYSMKIWSKLVSSYGEEKAAAMLISALKAFSDGYFDSMKTVSTLNTKMLAAERTKGDTWHSQVKTGKVKPARKVDSEELYKLKASGLAINEIADKLGVSRATVWRHLRDYRPVTYDCSNIFVDDDIDDVDDTHKRKMTIEEIFCD